MSNQRYRVMYKFWLDLTRDIDFELDEQIARLKRSRTFTGIIRDGIRLVLDLKAGKLDVLFELFPWVKAEFLAGIQIQSQNQNLEKLIQDAMRRLEQEMVLSTQAPTISVSSQIEQTSQVGPKTLNVPKFDLPTFDDDDLDTLVIHKDTTTNSTQNFLNSLMNLQQ